MKHLAIKWNDFIKYAIRWDRASVASRRLLIAMKFDGRVTAAQFGTDLDLLVQERLLAPFTDGRHVRWHGGATEFCRAMRAMSRHPIFDGPSEPALFRYLQDNFSRDEIGSLCLGVDDYSGSGYLLATAVSNEQWLRGFLESDPEEWERKRTRFLRFSSFEDAAMLKATRTLIQKAVTWPRPVAVRDLPSLLPDVSAESLAGAIHFCVQYLLLFPALRQHDLTPVFGVWPGVSARLNRPTAVVPPEVSARQTFSLAYRLEDMTTVLVAASAEGLRVRSNDNKLFAKAQDEIAANLPELPDWIDRFDVAARGGRIDAALRLMYELKLIATKGQSGKNLHIEPAAHAATWLAKDNTERLKDIFDHLRPREKLPSRFYYEAQFVRDRNLPEALVTAYRDVAGGKHIPLAGFLQWRAETENPFVERAGLARPAAIPFHWSFHAPANERIEEYWRQLLSAFLADYLLPFGGVEIGLGDDDSPCFAMTDVGRYVLGLADDFQYQRPGDESGQIVVQPNFDVVFLSPSPLAEANLARFAERTGRGLGALFKITKASILSAAAGGITRNQVLETLRGVSAKELPANVAREIEGWFASCREIRIKRAILIHCPDAQTAARVVAASGRKAQALTETVVELHDAKYKSTLLKKLKAHGVFANNFPSD